MATHYIASVKILGRRVGTPGTFKVSVQGVNGDQLPDGSEIASGTVNANDWTTDAAGIWYTITLDSPVVLTGNIMYALVFTTPDAPDGEPDQAMLRSHNVDGAYASGHYCSWARGGSSWSKDTAKDFYFEEWSASTKFQYYDSGGTTWNGLFADGRYAQTFTPLAGVALIPVATYKRLVAAGNNEIWYEDI